MPVLVRKRHKEAVVHQADSPDTAPAQHAACCTVAAVPGY